MGETLRSKANYDTSKVIALCFYLVAGPATIYMNKYILTTVNFPYGATQMPAHFEHGFREFERAFVGNAALGSALIKPQVRIRNRIRDKRLEKARAWPSTRARDSYLGLEFPQSLQQFGHDRVFLKNRGPLAHVRA